MKTSTLTAALFLFSTLFCSATSYYTLSAGDWNDPMIWSTDGVSNCFCVPAVPTTATSIDINHPIVGTCDITIDNGTKISVSPSASFFAPYDILTINAGEFVADNDIRFKKAVVNPGAKLVINNNLMYLYNQMVVYGTVEFDNAELFILLGNWNVYATGELYMRNNSVLRLAGGNYQNYGISYIETGSMIYGCGGNVTNYQGASFLGGGGVYTVGTLKNEKGGIWAPTLIFCAGGAISGIPGSEDCSIAPAECFIVPLAVSLLSFEGKGKEGVNELEWIIGAEISVKSYVIEKSIDGKDWTFLAEIDAVGSENNAKTYKFEDNEVTAEVSYYRLAVQDEEDNTVKDDFVTVKNRINHDAIVYPNPFHGSFKLNIGDSDYETFEIMDLTGKILFAGHVAGKVMELSIDQPVGVYLLRLKGQDEKVIRLIKK